MIQQKGVVVGRKQRKRHFSLIENEKDAIKQLSGRREWSVGDIYSYGCEYSKVFVDGAKYALGDHVVVALEGGTNCYGTISKIFSHEQAGEVNVFFSIDAIIGSLNCIDEMSGMFVIHKSQRDNVLSIVRPIHYLRHKFFFLPRRLDDMLVLYEL